MAIYDCGAPDCEECRRAFRSQKADREVVLTIYPNGESVDLRGSGYAVRCAAEIAHQNLPDARWALKVLNQYGHLVEHEAEAVRGGEMAQDQDDEELDRHGNPSDRIINCCFPDCGCDGARLCMAENGASSGAINMNLERRQPEDQRMARKANRK